MGLNPSQSQNYFIFYHYKYFDSRQYKRDFSLTYSSRPHYGPRVDSASNRNKYQEYFLGVKAAGA